MCCINETKIPHTGGFPVVLVLFFLHFYWSSSVYDTDSALFVFSFEYRAGTFPTRKDRGLQKQAINSPADFESKSVLNYVCRFYQHTFVIYRLRQTRSAGKR